MKLPLPLQRGLLLAALAFLGGAFAATSRAAEISTTDPSTHWDLADFIDGLPDILSERLPGFDQSGAVRLYVRPHFGDFIHRDYLRIPIGARIKVSENVENTVELQSYFTHGIGDSAGYGLSGLRLGTKRDHIFTGLNDGSGLSVGLNFDTPLSRPPIDLTDGHRHTQPYVAGTRPIMPKWKLLGYASVGADLLDRTPIRANFGRNQLHSNALTFAAGAAREWPRFRGSLTAVVTTSSLISDENKAVYALRPEVVFPWKIRPQATTQIMVTFSGRAVHGPDGTELGVGTSVRFEFSFHRKPAAK